MKFGITILLMLSFLLLAVTANAGSDRMTRTEYQELDFETRKQMRSDRLALQLEQLSAHKACVDTAIDDDGIKSCNKAARETMRKNRPHKGQINKHEMRKRFKEMQQEQLEAATQ